MKTLLTISMMFLVWAGALGQETVFTVLKDQEKVADAYVNRQEYFPAIEIYSHTLKRNPSDMDVCLKLARCFVAVRDYPNAVANYKRYLTARKSMPVSDYTSYGDALLILQDYTEAEQQYRSAAEADRSNEPVSKKLWRLKNIRFLYEDSSHYTVHPVPFVNSNATEMSATPYDGGIVFASNRKNLRPIDHLNGTYTSAFYSMYQAHQTHDSLTGDLIHSEIERLGGPLHGKHNTGPVAFYSGESKMVYVSTQPEAADDGTQTLGLFFASREGNRWKKQGAFPFNNPGYSVFDVTINEEGTEMYFSSDMKGGLGGRDIYTSRNIDGTWTRPANLGEPVNTNGDDVSPFIFRNTTLYFASNGHPGLGSLDVFRSTLVHGAFTEPENIGYPINTQHDDFSLVLDSTGNHGYLTSNRIRGGKDDDVLEFDMDLQAYPLTVSGTIRFKPFSWSEATDTSVGSNVRIVVVDSWRSSTVFETTTGADGNFKLSIPYFSRYHLIITDDAHVDHVVSLELGKYKTDSGNYEIVVVKDLFSQREQEKN